MKTPYEYVVAVLRASQFEFNSNQAMTTLRHVNFDVLNAPSPAGFDDIASAWTGPDSIMKRIEWGYSLAKKLPSDTHPLRLAESVLGDGLSELTRQAIVRAPSGVEALALMFASPEFQRR